ncbi:MAG: methyltransferase domain-containing protein, partial [Pacificimonas sp.]
AAPADEIGDLLGSEASDELTGDLSRLDSVRTTRVAAAERYFASHAGDWDRIRSLHVADSEVEASILRLLGRRPLGKLMDIGTGTGRMLELLAPRATSAIGIDRSAEMLRAARGKLEAAGLGDCPVRQGDMTALPAPDGSADTVVLHHVLHFADRPQLAIAEAARVLAPGGRLVIVDFAPHDREELRRDHAHARLGFKDEAVLGWLAKAGLTTRPPKHFEGPLTVTIWLAERPPHKLKAVA